MTLSSRYQHLQTGASRSVVAILCTSIWLSQEACLLRIIRTNGFRLRRSHIFLE